MDRKTSILMIQMQNRIKTMNAGEYNHGFAVEWMRKDLGIALEEARKQGVSLPVTAVVDQFYAEVENLGGKRWDTSSLFVRQETARKGNGTGLGLPLTKAMVEANRASFTIKSKRGEGTLVEVTFPSTRVLAE